MLICDIHEDLRLFQAIKQMVPEAEQISTSQQNWPDFTFTGKDGMHGLEHKHWSEILGSLDHIEEQLGRQHPTVDHHGLIIRGVMTPWDKGKSCMTWDNAGSWMKATGRGWDRLTQKPLAYHQNYRGLIQKLARFQEWGITIYQVASWSDTAELVVGLYNEAQNPEESKTFKRLIRPKREITWGVEDEGKRKLAMQLMAFDVGEEVAVAIAGRYGSIVDILNGWTDNSELQDKYLATIPLRSGKRTVGPAAVAKLRTALGV